MSAAPGGTPSRPFLRPKERPKAVFSRSGLTFRRDLPLPGTERTGRRRTQDGPCLPAEVRAVIVRRHRSAPERCPAGKDAPLPALRKRPGRTGRRSPAERINRALRKSTLPENEGALPTLRRTLFPTARVEISSTPSGRDGLLHQTPDNPPPGRASTETALPRGGVPAAAFPAAGPRIGTRRKGFSKTEAGRLHAAKTQAGRGRTCRRNATPFPCPYWSGPPARARKEA